MAAWNLAATRTPIATSTAVGYGGVQHCGDQDPKSMEGTKGGGFDDSYRFKFWLLDSFLVLLTVGNLVFAAFQVAESNIPKGEVSMLVIGARTGAFKLVVEFFVWLPLSFALRSLLLTRCVGVSDAHYHAIMVNRDRFDLAAMKEAYTELNIQKCDCLVRKSFHIIQIAFAASFELPFVAKGYAPAMVLGVAIQCAVLSFLRISISYGRLLEDSLLVQTWLYRAPRVRDGREAFINIRVCSVASGLGMTVCGAMIELFTDCGANAIDADADASDSKVIAYKKILQSMANLSYFPLAFGDAMGEVIGSFYGKHTFAVRGFGEVNKKSFEGCAAVFAFSLASTLLSTYVISPIELRGETVEWKLWLPVCIALLTMVTETVAFRSTDNFFIPVCNAALVIMIFTVVRDEC